VLRVFLLCAILLPSFARALNGQVRHPLDPLDWQEHWTVLEALRDAGHLNDSTRFSLVKLHEIFVPYMDPAMSWYSRNFLDAGEFSAGGLAKPLEPGIDCPDNADYLDLTVAGDNGRPRIIS
jgi:Cu2+-containing amine oxidase